MSFSTVLSAALQGLHVVFVHVEADLSNGLPMFHMVGYLSSEVKEAAERVRTAIRNSDIQLPAKKMVINLSPATVKKRGASFDLPIAVAILASLGLVPEERLKETLFIGELSLDGSMQQVAGILPIVLEARKAGCRACVLPRSNAREGALAEGIEILGADSLREVYAHLTGTQIITPEICSSKDREAGAWSGDGAPAPDYSDMRGQRALKRAAEVAVAGGHNLLLVGPPGSGKSMLARRIPTILPPASRGESMEITKIYSIMGMVDKENPLITGRPFRSVHHTATRAAMIGGGVIPTPGEISLAHGGVLFLDELTEFQKSVLEVLRQPLEERQIRITRNSGSYVFPSDFMLVAAMNPCPCGNYPDLNRCSCTPGQIQNYLGKISQPFLDRLDLCVEAPKMEYDALKGPSLEESSAAIRERVCRARDIQCARYQGMGISANGALGVKELGQYCALGREEEALMRQAFAKLGLTARTYHKILKVARTVADLDGADKIESRHLKEAVAYRTIDKKYWGR